MKAEPEKSLKAVSTSIYLSHGMPYPVVTFEDGSVWRRTGEGWVLSWQPEPEPAEALADSDPVMTYEEVLSSANRNIRRVAELEAKLVAIKAQQRVTIKADELRAGDVIRIFGADRVIESIGSTGRHALRGVETVSTREEMIEFLARGVEVYRDGELISGWPLGSPPVRVAWSGEDILASQLKAWQEAANIRSSVKISSPDDLGKRIAELEAQLKAWQEAASVDLVENPDEPPTPCRTPEQLIERLRHLYRLALKAEMDARELRKPMNEIIGIVNKVPPF